MWIVIPGKTFSLSTRDAVLDKYPVGAPCSQRCQKTSPCKATIICSSSCRLKTRAKWYLYLSWLSTDDTSHPWTAISQPRFSITLTGSFRDGFMNWKRFLHYWPFIIPQPVALGFPPPPPPPPREPKLLWWRHQMETFFCVTGHLCGEFTGHRWISRTKVSDAELWCFLSSAPEWRLRKP